MPGIDRVLPALTLLVGLGVALTQAPSSAYAQGAEYAARGADTCLRCHRDEPSTQLLLKSQHAQRADSRTPFAAKDCETCHGPSPEHLVKPAEGEKRAPPMIVFGRDSATPAAEQNKVCLGCHESAMRIAWRGSQHDFAGNACTFCHEVHTAKDKVLLRKTQSQVCFTCHVTQRAESFRFSHHPVREGQVGCSDCHNPHGTFGPKMLVKNTVNDTCFQCHMEKRGPFLWQHIPVRDDCRNCHVPHGSTQPRLLKVRAPWLCQQCHIDGHFDDLRSGEDLAAFDQRIVGKGCVNCHSQIHGSNHPSGVRFMR